MEAATHRHLHAYTIESRRDGTVITSGWHTRRMQRRLPCKDEMQRSVIFGSFSVWASSGPTPPAPTVAPQTLEMNHERHY